MVVSAVNHSIAAQRLSEEMLTFLDSHTGGNVFSLLQWEGKVEQGEREFEQISKTIRKEVGRFEVRAQAYILN